MRVVRADVVLNEQAVAVACRGCFQAWMVELQRSRAVEALHESGNKRSVLLGQLPDMGAIDRLVGEMRRQLIERLVQIHDQQVEAVFVTAFAAGQGLQLRRIERRSDLAEPSAPLVDARAKRGMRFFGAALDRPCHRAQIVAQFRRQLGQLCEMQCRTFKVGGAGKFDDPRRIDMRCGIFPMQVELRCPGMIGMGMGCLQRRQIEFQPIVGSQCRLDPGRPQEFGLPKRGNDVGLLHVQLQ
ncbi:hypothetical protein [Mesorhizobium sp. ES1-4]|uniref:hypothetical protein n=1 Tax=Mesorhizobium sp. ES1-4 TaxID=2876627 RepID=UPI001CCBFB16|nr:hypothetical protein [Mesorhizobium sp. ES1-4]MBZ9797269.1 hypothetical protein [Mesorhizobium sp. ES1-4]